MRTALAISLIGLGFFALGVCLAFPQPMFDEAIHWPVVHDLATGKSERVAGLPMLPTYHALAASVVALTEPSLLIARGVSVVIGALSLLTFAALLRALGRAGDVGAFTRFALQPLLVPFWVLVYTDLCGLLPILLALLLAARGREIASSGAWILGTLVRQSNAFWPVLALLTPPAGGSPLAHRRRERSWSVAVALAASAVIVVVDSQFRTRPVENRAEPNIAQLHIALLTAAILWLPIWLPHLKRIWRPVLEPRLFRPRWAALAVGVVGLLIVAFENHHPWNTERQYLRNLPLIAMMAEPLLIGPIGALLVLFTVTHAHYIWTSSARGRLVALAVLSAAYIAPHVLVDPRYYIVPVVMMDLMTPYNPDESRRLTRWYALLAVGVAAWLILHPGGGML